MTHNASDQTKTPRSNSRDKTGAPRRVFAFGCVKVPEDSLRILREQAWKANDVQNAMIHNEIDCRQARERVLAEHIPEYAAARQAALDLSSVIDEMYAKLAEQRQETRTRVVPNGFEEQVRKLKDERATCWKRAAAAKKPALKELLPWWEQAKAIKAELVENGGSTSSKSRSVAHERAIRKVIESGKAPALWCALAEIGMKQSEAHTAIRRKAWRPDGDSEHWAEGSDQLHSDVKEMAREAFLQAASKTSAEGGRMRERRGSEGRVGLMWNSDDAPTVGEGNSIASRSFSLEMADTRDGNRDPDSRRSRLRKRMIARMILGASTVSVPVLVHRELPLGAIIRRAWFMLKPRGRVELQLVVQHPMLNDRPVGKRLEAVAIRVGWSAQDALAGELGAIKVASFVGSDGTYGVVELDARTNQALVEIRSLKTSQDDHHNEALKEVRAWSKRTGELAAELEHAHAWRSPRHLAAIAFTMRDQIQDLEALWQAWKQDCNQVRADYFLPIEETRLWLKGRGVTDERIVMAVYLEWWRRKNRHLRTFEQNMRETAQLRRRERYRVAAAKLASKYERLVIVDVSLKSAARKKRPEQEIEGPENLWTRQRRNASPSELISCLANAFRVKADRVRVKATSLEEALERLETSDTVATMPKTIAAE